MEDLVDYEEVYALQRLNFYKKQGIELWMEEGKLKFKGAKDKVSTKILAEIRKDKAAIINYLRESSKRTNECFSLTPIQLAYLIGGGADYELGKTNAHFYVEYEADFIDCARLQDAINEVIRHHDALRLVVEQEGKQRVLAKVPTYLIQMVEIKSEAALQDIRKEWSHHIYALGEWPMFHFQVSQMPNKTYRLHVDFDCLILDAWSARMMLNHIFTLYEGKSVKWPSFTFESYMRAIQSLLEESSNKAAKAYWEEAIKKMPPCPKLSYRCKFNEVDVPYYKRLQYQFSYEETAKFYQKIKNEHFTPSAVMCTLFMKVLSCYSEEKDLTIDLTLFNRKMIHKEVNEVLGDFTNVGFASYYYNEEAHFVDEVKNVQRQFWKLVQYHSYDGTQILREIAKKSPGKAIMPIVFTSVLQGAAMQKEENKFKEIYAISQTPQTAIDHQLRDDNGSLSLSWDYIAELFNPAMIKKMFDMYIALIKSVIVEDDWNQRINIEAHKERED